MHMHGLVGSVWPKPDHPCAAALQNARPQHYAVPGYTRVGVQGTKLGCSALCMAQKTMAGRPFQDQSPNGRHAGS